jgi:hypothetical protein
MGSSAWSRLGNTAPAELFADWHLCLNSMAPPVSVPGLRHPRLRALCFELPNQLLLQLALIVRRCKQERKKPLWKAASANFIIQCHVARPPSYRTRGVFLPA